MKNLARIKGAENVNSHFGIIKESYTGKSGETMYLIKVACSMDWNPWLCRNHCILIGESFVEVIGK